MADWRLYCDESCKNERWMVLGGVLLRAEIADELRGRVDKWRQGCGLTGEISWKKTTDDRLTRYKEFATGTLVRARHGFLAYQATVFDQSDDALYPGIPACDRLGKRIHQFLLHCFGMNLRRSDRLWIYPDRGMLACTADKLQEMLNAGIAKRRGWQAAEIVSGVTPLDSKASTYIQMADVLSGAIGGSLNQNYDCNSARGAAKESLIEHVRQQARVNGFNASVRRTDFGIWHFMPAKKERPEPYPIAWEVSAEPRHSGSATLR